MPELPLTIAEAAEWLRSGRITSVALTEAQLARAHATQDTLAAFILDHGRRRAGRRAPGRRRLRGRHRQGPAPGHPARRQGHHRHEGRARAPRTAACSTRPGASATTPPSSRSCARPAPSSSASSACTSTRSAGRTPTPASASRRTRGTSSRTPGGSSSGTGAAVGGGVILGGLGHLHRRLGPRPGLVLRHQRHEADVRAGQQGRLRPARLQPRPHRPDGAHRPRLRPHAPGHGRLRPARPLLGGHAGPGHARAAGPARWQGVRIGVPRDYFFTVPNLDDEVKATVEAALDGDGGGRRDAGGGRDPARRRRPPRPARHDDLRGVRLPRAGPAVEAGAVRQVHPRGVPARRLLHAPPTTSRPSGSAR